MVSKAERLSETEISKIALLLEISSLSMTVIAKVMRATPQAIAAINRRYGVREYSLRRDETAQLTK
jgi:hypothetical protein